jgi:hypothetical protein
MLRDPAADGAHPSGTDAERMLRECSGLTLQRHLKDWVFRADAG